MSVVRLKTLFWEIERRNQLWSYAPHSPETGATLIYATSAINFNGCFSDRAYALSVSRKGISSSVSECPDAHPRPVRSLSVQVKSTKVRAKVLEKRISDEQKGGKNDIFLLLVSFPAKLGGPMRAGLKDGVVARSPSNISDVRGQVEDIILGNRETQN
ncbi:hypothetical protein TNIN_249411 [Trichonephila inaurata madagascariensis]|uniref:Uncharacterized protein n=1 Tax=Trichonephila inaurata madagascariensis TaxID=2747483 RepID=A0A8X6XHD7_9ARAC|nr:hypothetical protein TNIN_249411 [Trichonephila inaurata madagascariensis]